MFYELLLLRVRSNLLIQIQLQADCLKNFIFTILKTVTHPGVFSKTEFQTFLFRVAICST